MSDQRGKESLNFDERSQGTMAYFAGWKDDVGNGLGREADVETRRETAMIRLDPYVAPPKFIALDVQRASDFQTALLGMVGHDLRQPLQVIQSAYEMVEQPRRRCLGEDPPGEGRARARIDRATRSTGERAAPLRIPKAWRLRRLPWHCLFWRIASENEIDAQAKGIEMRDPRHARGGYEQPRPSRRHLAQSGAARPEVHGPG